MWIDLNLVHRHGQLAGRDRDAYWNREAETVEKMWSTGRMRDLYQQTRMYAGKRRPAGILFLKDLQGLPLESPEERMGEWTREFKQRLNPHVPVQYDCTSEASEEEWNGDAREADATTASAEERQR